jgi:hypothetical protein
VEEKATRQNPKLQTPNSKQVQKFNYQMTQTISFEILVIEIYFGSGAWNWVLHAKGLPCPLRYAVLFRDGSDS